LERGGLHSKGRECKRNRMNRMGGREECRILTECWREKKKNTEKEREKYYQSKRKMELIHLPFV
jgi:hypothetical protein